MDSSRTNGQAYFKALLLTVVGQAYAAAGYALEEQAMAQLGGRYRFRKPLDAPWAAYIDYQVLVYTATDHAAQQANRFRITLTRSDQAGGKASAHPRYAQRSLAALVVADFGVAILPSAEHWWSFSDTDSLGKALAESGHLVVGYGLQWLDGTLLPPA